MKKQMLLVAIIATFFTSNQVKSQNVSGHQMVFDTVNISVGNHPINADRDIFIGQMKVYDPEHGELSYSINYQVNEDLFYVDQRGILWANYQRMLHCLSLKEFKIEVGVSDGENTTLGLVIIKVNGE